MPDYKPLVLTVDALPVSGNDIGDKRLVLFTKAVYEWNGSSWVEEVSLAPKIKKIIWVEGEV